MLIRFTRIRVFAFALLMGTAVLPEGGCSSKHEHAAKFICPMHPTYVSDRPGDCPICGMRLVPASEGASTKKASTTTSTAAYACPMDPEVVSDEPSRCPKCGMKLVKVDREKPKDLGEVMATPEGMRQAGVKVDVVGKRVLSVGVVAAGTVVPDERSVRMVTVKIAGYVEKLFVNFTGQAVRKGQPVVSVFSPELLASQEEYLQALSATGTGELGTAMLEAARRRLELFDFPQSALRELERTRKAQRVVTLVSPMAGTVSIKGVVEGQRIEPGKELFAVTDLSRVWIEAALYPAEAARVAVGQSATFRFPQDPGRTLSGKVRFIDPLVKLDTRTVTARFDVANPKGELRPGMYVDVLFEGGTEELLAVPDSAVIRTGVRDVVYVQSGEGQFSPRVVKLGVRGGGFVEVRSGLMEGENVAVQGNFLLDSEARIQGALLPPEAP